MSARHDDVILCAEPGCPRAAAYRSRCIEHSATPPRVTSIAHDLSDAEYAKLRAQVAADAAPLFLLALQFILGRQVKTIVDEALALEAGQ